MASIFTKIIEGQIPGWKITENDKFIAILDVFPLAKGHVLVIPKQETDYIFDIEDNQFAELQLFAKKVAAAMRKAIECKRIGVAVIGLEVPHAHIHLIPLNHVSDINFERPKLKFTDDEMKEVCEKIKAYL